MIYYIPIENNFARGIIEMIKNTNEILAKKIKDTEDILKKLMQEMIELEKERKLTIDTTEGLLGFAISQFMQISLDMSGQVLSNLDTEKKTRIAPNVVKK